MKYNKKSSPRWNISFFFLKLVKVTWHWFLNDYMLHTPIQSSLSQNHSLVWPTAAKRTVLLLLSTWPVRSFQFLFLSAPSLATPFIKVLGFFLAEQWWKKSKKKRKQDINHVNKELRKLKKKKKSLAWQTVCWLVLEVGNDKKSRLLFSEQCSL